jgi:hypothetical protein
MIPYLTNIMAEQEKQDINTSIEAKINEAGNRKGLKLGDDLVNDREKELYDKIISEQGEAIASTREAMNADFSNLLEDVWDLSEWNQRQLREVAEMLNITLQTKDGGLQMNYELFQEILKFQKKQGMKLTGIVDDTLYQELKKHGEGEGKAETPNTSLVQEKKTEETPKLRAEPITTNPLAGEEGSSSDTILPPATPGIAQNAGQHIGKLTPNIAVSEWGKAPVATPPEKPTTTTASTPETPPAPEKPQLVALPLAETPEKTAQVETILNEEAKKLWITINGLEIAEEPLGKEIVDMIIYYEWPGGRRQPDVGWYDIWGGINTGSSVEEKKYALGENYDAWNSSFIPKENVRECVLRFLNVRIALTRKSCADKWVDFDSLPQYVKGVLVDLHYNMPNNINQFTKFWTAIKGWNWQEAGKQLVDNGNGSHSGYLSQVAGRAYANALMLANWDTNYREYKHEAEKISGGANLLNQYNQKVGEYGKKVGMWERKEIVNNAQNVGDIIAQTTSDDVLKTKWSTQSIRKILDKYIAEHPEERSALIAGLSEKMGKFTHLLQNSAEVWAFQQLVYLTNHEAFKQLEYIDGEYGRKTEAAFVLEAFSMGGWQEKIEGANGLLSKNPTDISTYIGWLNEFEKGLLQRHYSGATCNANSSPDDIKKAQLWLALSGTNLAVDGVWNDQMRELLEYPELAKSLGNFVENNYSRYGSGAYSCGASVGKMLNGFGIQALPQSGRDGKNWNEILDARVKLGQFTKVIINSPDEARPGGILCYDGGGGGRRSYMAKKHGHVEVKWTNGHYYHYLDSSYWGGSAGASVENSQFTKCVYYPRKLEA